MGWGGSVLSMINSLKWNNNQLKHKRSYKYLRQRIKDEIFQNVSKHSENVKEYNSIIANPELLKTIRMKLQRENRLATFYTLAVTSLVTLTLGCLIWKYVF